MTSHLQNSKQTVGVVACGWLGLPLASQLVRDGYKVYGSRRSTRHFNSLRSSGIFPFKIELQATPVGDLAVFERLDCLVLNVPPGNARQYQGLSHEQQLESLAGAIKKAGIPRVIFISTTSVYPDDARVMKEEDAEYIPSKHSGTVALRFEDVLREASGAELVVLRFGGLFGPERHPGHFFRNRKEVTGAEHPVNMIHQEDCIGIIGTLIADWPGAGVYNACSPEHPTKEEFYTAASNHVGTQAPKFHIAGEGGKTVCPQKLIDEIKYEFRYPNPIQAL